MQGYWKSKPPAGVQLDYGHPLASGLRAAVLLSEGAGNPANGVGPKLLTPVGPPTWSANQYGKVGRFSGSTQYYVWDQPVLNLDSVFSIFARAMTTTVAAGVRNIFASGQAAAYSVQLRINAAQLETYVKNDAGADVGALAASALTANVWFTSTSVWDGATLRLYKNGEQKATAALTTKDRSDVENSIGADSTLATPGQFWNGDIDFVYVWQGRFLTAKEVKSLHSDPFQIFQAPVWRRWFVPTAVAAVAPKQQYYRRRRV